MARQAKYKFELGFPLSPRERAVARMIAAGKEPAEMAAELGIGLKTVGTYRDRIKQKTGSRNNVEICLWWMRDNGPTN